MKFSFSKCFFVIILCCSFSFAQEKPRAVLIDEFGNLDCEEFWARQDAFFVEILNSPNSTGYAVVYGKKNKTQLNLNKEILINGISNFSKFDKDRLIVVRAKEGDEPHIKFWVVPAGADKPDFDETKWNLTFSKKQKPFLFFSSNDSDLVCPGEGRLRIYSEYLTENPKTRANIVIYEKSKSEFLKQKAEFLSELIEKYNISPKRIRFLFVKVKPDNENFEFWLLP